MEPVGDETLSVFGNTKRLSVVVPTRNEAANVPVLLSQLATVLPDSAEVIFVDDSDDNTPEAVRRCAGQFPFDVRLIARPPDHRHDGLGGAVVEGFRAARGEWLLVMDADLQHPPVIIPQMLAAAESADADLVLGTRLARVGDASGLNRRRNLVSRLLALLTKLVFPMRLRPISDPLTGLFLLRNGVVDWDQLRPSGFKILLEIVVRFPLLRLAEVPFRFEQRHAGESKASVREVVRLLRHFVRLRLSADQYLIRFVAASLTLLLIETLPLLAVRPTGWGALLFVAEIGIVAHFLINEQWVFRDRRRPGQRSGRIVGYFLFANLLLLVRLPLVLLTPLSVASANVLATVLLFVPHFLFADQVLWQRLRHQPLYRDLPQTSLPRRIWRWLTG